MEQPDCRWPIAEAKARLSEVIDRARRAGPPVISLQNGRITAVVVSIEEWERKTTRSGWLDFLWLRHYVAQTSTLSGPRTKHGSLNRELSHQDQCRFRSCETASKPTGSAHPQPNAREPQCQILPLLHFQFSGSHVTQSELVPLLDPSAVLLSFGGAASLALRLSQEAGRSRVASTSNGRR
jgi:prevent-host-death family protein